MNRAAANRPDAHADLNRPPRQSRCHAGAHPAAEDRHRNQRREHRRVHLHDDQEDERLHHDRQRVADQHGADDALIGNHAQQLVGRRRGRERANAQGVEEVGDESDRDLHQ